MKLLSKISMGALVLAIGFTSCKKDKDDDSNGNGGSTAKNEMTIKGNSSTIIGGLQSDYGMVDSNIYNFDLLLWSDSIVYVDSTESIAGIGNILYFEMFTSSSTGLATGTYIFSNNLNANTFDIGEAAVNFDTETETGDELIETNSGTVTIDKDGDTYIIDIEMADGAGGTITAHYEGTLYKD